MGAVESSEKYKLVEDSKKNYGSSRIGDKCLVINSSKLDSLKLDNSYNGSIEFVDVKGYSDNERYAKYRNIIRNEEVKLCIVIYDACDRETYDVAMKLLLSICYHVNTIIVGYCDGYNREVMYHEVDETCSNLGIPFVEVKDTSAIVKLANVMIETNKRPIFI